MDANDKLTVDGGAAGVVASGRRLGRPGGRNVWPWVNWGLALATVLAAAIVMLFALGAVMSTDGCSDRSCPNLGHGGIDSGVAFYVRTGGGRRRHHRLVLDRQTPRRHRVPLCGWALLITDVALMAASVSS
ncbi:hypothetical protein MLM_0615 [Mycobacterium lepraemurium]|nr:hypothetical protein MLM_0615 [Mycobacterium lepraemurium]